MLSTKVDHQTRTNVSDSQPITHEVNVQERSAKVGDRDFVESIGQSHGREQGCLEDVRPLPIDLGVRSRVYGDLIGSMVGSFSTKDLNTSPIERERGIGAVLGGECEAPLRVSGDIARQRPLEVDTMPTVKKHAQGS